MYSVNYDSTVFNAPGPRCKNDNGTLDFKIFENYLNSGIDWIQWYCTNDDCNYYINVEII